MFTELPKTVVSKGLPTLWKGFLSQQFTKFPKDFEKPTSHNELQTLLKKC